MQKMAFSSSSEIAVGPNVSTMNPTSTISNSNKPQKVKISALDSSRRSNSEESDYEPSRDPNRYVRLREEHVEAVVILRHGSIIREETKDAEALSRNNGKLTFNLTPEQLGNATSCSVVCEAKKSSSVGSMSLEGKDGTRKSSLRRNSLRSQQSELEKQLVLENPMPVPQQAGMYDIPKKILMPICSEERDFVDKSDTQDRKSHMKFDEILTIFDQFPTDFLPSKYICGICKRLCNDPRVLDCLHNFCKRCLIELEASSHSGSSNFWRRINEQSSSLDLDSDATVYDTGDENGQNEKLPSAAAHESTRAIRSVANHETFSGESRFDQIRASFQSFKEKNCLKSPSKEKVRKGSSRTKLMNSDKDRLLICPNCGFATDIPLGGASRLPPHFVMARKIDDIVSACDPPPNILCELCTDDVTATSSCSTCSLKLCNFCKEAHQRQRNTSTHIVRTVAELLKKSRRTDPEARSIKCPMHPEHQLTLFCTTCHQVVCNECAAHVHQDHKYTSALKACKIYDRFVRNAIEQTKPMEDYARQSIGRLNDMSVRINNKCEAVQQDVEAFIDEYAEALDEHRKSLLKQIDDVREAKLEMIIAQQAELEQRSQNARTAIDFAEEIINEGNEVENLVFVSILLKRLQHCIKSNRTLDFKVTDTLEFLPDEVAPCAKVQNRIALYGVVTTQKADPRKCTLENCVGLTCLKVHKKVELSLVTRDYEGKSMNHGGITVHTDLRYRGDESRVISLSIVDKRDGSYRLSFVPERAGVMNLMIFVDGKVIEGCPYVLRIHNLRAHYGVYHCCSFCSSNGSKLSTCACGSVMPGGYRGCGHGHEGHPGQRHWSCCANFKEYSDCEAANVKSSKVG
ncbi:E3 ubiquitin-protein ligase TRIM45 [Topomyia yanbarensis]|uniref:E3 ubiquitin-protein ligase TRIM45 n=1 Tax=Topomyia yanbarensis TaxID=2498891 RepID=UPI00273C90AF|nr:E3 ubiquitin-protein ligase TRIM45 [Topomyia yanbarensis]